MRILLACEESQIVTKEFRKFGHEAYSCDIIECSGGHPEWHIKTDVLSILNDNWDMMIAFPPCTFLTSAGNRWFDKRYNLQPDMFNGLVTRQDKRIIAYDFFMQLINAPIERIAIENPVGVVNKWYRKPDQIIHPYFFGDNFKKRSCLWLKNLPLLRNTKLLPEPQALTFWKNGKAGHWCESLGRNKDRAKVRSKTFPRIAKAMAEQWNFQKIEILKANSIDEMLLMLNNTYRKSMITN